ncbi:hypothetical protein HY622_02535 [Candidatus Uhrbacteria bacterium]|nr:hypothetical protein [Candidatus Uhrbacteria bacterium]
MGILTVPLTTHLSEKIEELIKNGRAANKADLARRALEKYIEDQAVADVLNAEREVCEGKALSGDLDELAAKL